MRWLMMILISILIIAVISDFQSYKIPNLVILTGLVLGIFYRMEQDGVIGIINAFVCMILIFLFLFPFFLIHGIGAGDVKLFCVMASFLSMKHTMICFVYSFVLAAILSVFKMLQQKTLRYRLQHIMLYIHSMFMTNSIRSFAAKEEMKASCNVIRLSLPVLISFIVLMIQNGIGVCI